ncbi:aminotransferase class IV [Alcaligenaceae bacterium CGII-47]|nr:aminotransferase class IV [Alcaligenaceae bacterium CGII-47]
MESPRSEPCLIETMRFAQGHIALWPGHLQRLATSSAALGYVWAPHHVQAQVAQQCARLDKQEVFRIRLLLARDGQCQIEASPLPPTSCPVRIALAPEPLIAEALWLRHKTTHRPWYAAAQTWLAQNPDIFDVIYSNPQAQLCEGSRSNIYLSDGAGHWLTPAPDSGLLPGVQRQALLDAGLVREARLSAEDLRTASAIRVSNALRGWLDANLII